MIAIANKSRAVFFDGGVLNGIKPICFGKEIRFHFDNPKASIKMERLRLPTKLIKPQIKVSGQAADVSWLKV